jgi:hypothetical protein
MGRHPNPGKKLVITPTVEGATNHSVMEKRSLVDQVLFDCIPKGLLAVRQHSAFKNKKAAQSAQN